MKKITLFSALALFVMLAISCGGETNYTTDGHYGKVIIYNEAASGATITRINISDSSYWSDGAIYNEKVTISPGKSSNEYELELTLIYDILYSSYNVTVTLDDNTTKSKNITAYEDIVNRLYYNGTDLVERKE